MIISYINKIDRTDFTLTSSSEEADYPVTNVQQEHLSLVWLATGDTSEWIKLDTGTTITPLGAFLAGTNLSDTAVVKIQGNATDVWTSPSVDVTMERVNGICYSYSSDLEVALRYWRFSIVDTANVDGYVEIGRAWIGRTLTIDGPHTSFTEKRINTSETTISITGQSYGNEGYIYKMWDMTFPYWDADEKGNMETFADTVNKAQPFFIQFADSNDCQLGPFYVLMTNDMEFNHMKTLDIWCSQLSIREIK